MTRFAGNVMIFALGMVGVVLLAVAVGVFVPRWGFGIFAGAGGVWGLVNFLMWRGWLAPIVLMAARWEAGRRKRRRELGVPAQSAPAKAGDGETVQEKVERLVAAQIVRDQAREEVRAKAAKSATVEGVLAALEEDLQLRIATEVAAELNALYPDLHLTPQELHEETLREARRHRSTHGRN